MFNKVVVKMNNKFRNRFGLGCLVSHSLVVPNWAKRDHCEIS